MRDGPTDFIEYVVEKPEGGTWTVFSLVMTPLGSKPAKNFIVQNDSKKWCEGFAAALRAQESRRTPEPLPEPLDWQKAVRDITKEKVGW